MKVSRLYLAATACRYSPAWRPAVEAAATVDLAGQLDIPEETYVRICAQHPRAPRPADRPLPSLPRRAANAAGAIGRLAVTVLRRQSILAPADVQLARTTLCTACDQFRTDGRCAKCGCWMKPKIRLASERCPAGKWAPCIDNSTSLQTP